MDRPAPEEIAEDNAEDERNRREAFQIFMRMNYEDMAAAHPIPGRSSLEGDGELREAVTKAVATRARVSITLQRVFDAVWSGNPTPKYEEVAPK